MPDTSMVTMGDIIQDAVTEQAMFSLGHPGYDGIDDTELEILFTFSVSVMKRCVEKVEECKRRGRTVSPIYTLSDEEPDDPRDSAITGRKCEEASSHPSVSGRVQEVPDQRRSESSRPSSNVTSIVGKQRRSKGGG